MQRKKIGLALSGGGARGFSHVGVMRVLVENDIPIDMIAGTSAGSIVGGAFASGMSIDEIEAMASRVGWGNIVRPSMSPRGLFSSAPMGEFIEREFHATAFEDLKIPFAAVACDLEADKKIVFRERGDLSFAIRASCALPGVFAPLRDDQDRFLVDGGMVSPMPVEVVRQMGADVVIGVDLIASGATFSPPRTAFGMMLQSAMMLLRVVSRSQHNDADVIIIPQIAHLRPDQINKRSEFIELGQSAAMEKLGKIRAII